MSAKPTRREVLPVDMKNEDFKGVGTGRDPAAQVLTGLPGKSQAQRLAPGIISLRAHPFHFWDSL